MEARRQQRTFGDGFLSELQEQVGDLWEDWMRHADRVLEDEKILEPVYEVLAHRYPLSQKRGRQGTPAEVVLRLLVLKHLRNWSYRVVEREVKANLVYREFTRVRAEKVPSHKTLEKLGLVVGPEVIQKIHQRIVAIAQEKGVVNGKKLRVDTTVVETNIHYPTDSSLMGDGVRVLTRTMKKITEIAGEAGARLRDRSRSVKYRLIEIGRASRGKSQQGKEKMKQAYGKLLAATRAVLGQAKRFSEEIASGVKRSAGVIEQAVLEGCKKELDTIGTRVEQVIKQTKQRVFGGNNHVAGKLLSLFEPSTEAIRRGKASKPTEFGKMVKIQEAENQITIDYEVYEKRPADSDLLIPSIEVHRQTLGRTPHLAAADAGFYSAHNEATAQELGVQQVSIPNRSTKSQERKRLQRKRWFRNGQKWRTGCEGRISVLKRRQGLNRCRYKGEPGMNRWVGLGIISDNLINIGRHLAQQNSG
ncbi:MAG: ISNCY family transposase [Terriglobales bacterium]